MDSNSTNIYCLTGILTVILLDEATRGFQTQTSNVTWPQASPCAALKADADVSQLCSPAFWIPWSAVGKVRHNLRILKRHPTPPHKSLVNISGGGHAKHMSRELNNYIFLKLVGVGCLFRLLIILSTKSITDIVHLSEPAMASPYCKHLLQRANSKLDQYAACTFLLLLYVIPSRATHDARCFRIGFYLPGKVNGQMRVSEGTLPLGVEPPSTVYTYKSYPVQNTTTDT